MGRDPISWRTVTRRFARRFPDSLPRTHLTSMSQPSIAAIGPVTADAATQVGLSVTVIPAVSTIPALVDAIAMHVSQGRPAV